MERSGPEVELRVPSGDDAPRVHEAVRESFDELSAWMDWCVPDYGLDHARQWLEEQARLHATGEGFEFLVEDLRGRLLGACGLNQLNRAQRLANLGYWVRSSATGRGVAPAAVRAVARWAFASTDLERLEIVVLEGNHRSLRVAEKAGARREGVLRARIRHREESHDAVMFSLVRRDLGEDG